MKRFLVLVLMFFSFNLLFLSYLVITFVGLPCKYKSLISSSVTLLNSSEKSIVRILSFNWIFNILVSLGNKELKPFVIIAYTKHFVNTRIFNLSQKSYPNALVCTKFGNTWRKYQKCTLFAFVIVAPLLTFSGVVAKIRYVPKVL